VSYDPRAYQQDGIDDRGKFPEVTNRWGTGTVPSFRHCLRCGAYVADPERHDRWHGVMDK
jgi:hypothetical protein